MSTYQTPRGVVEFSGRAFKALEPQQQENLKALWNSGADFDHNFLLSQPKDKQANLFAVLNDRQRGRDTSIDVEAQRPQAEAFGPVVGTADAFLQGISAGTADEGIAGLASLIGPGSYDDYFDYQTQARQGFANDNGGLALGGEVVGGMLGLGKLTGAALAKTAGQSALRRGGAAAGVGAGEGALYGFATGDGLENRLEQAGTDAAIGAVAGSIGGKIIEAAVGVGGAVVKGILRKVNDTPAKEVERLVVRAAEAEGIDANEAIKILKELGPEATFMDLGANFRMLARDVKSKVGTGKTLLPEFLDTRQRGVLEEGATKATNSQQSRLLDAAVESAGEDGQNLRRSMEEVQAEMKAVADPIYDAAYRTPFEMNPEIKRLLDKPAARTAYEAAKTRIENKPENISLSPVRRLDETIRALQDEADGLFRDNRGGEAGDIKDLMIALRAQLDEGVPDLQTARQIWRDGSAVQRAGEKGRGLLQQGVDPEDLADDVADMSAAELDMFRRGGMKAVERRLADTADNRDAGALLSNRETMREKLGMLFDDPEPFQRQLDAERAFTETKRVVSGGSITNEAGQVQQDFGVEGVLNAASAMRGTKPDMAIRVIEYLIGEGRMSDQAATEIAQLMVKRGMSDKEVRELLNDAAFKRAAGDLYPQFSKAMKDAFKGTATAGALAISGD
jgi:hypothetical protein